MTVVTSPPADEPGAVITPAGQDLSSPMQVVAFVILGTVALIIAGVQPLVLGDLVLAHRLSASGLGGAMAVEFLALSLTVGAAGAKLPPRHLRWRGIISSAMLLLANIATAHLDGTGIILSRAVAGIAEGLMLSVVTLVVVRSSAPARWAGVLFVTQGLCQLLFAAAIPVFFLPRYGANGSFYGLAATAALALVASPGLLDRFAPVQADARDEDVVVAKLSGEAKISLLSVFLIFAFFQGFFAYMAALAEQAGLSAGQVASTVSIAVATSIAGSAFATIVPKRIPYFAIFLASLPVCAATLAILDMLPGATVFIGTVALYGFFWGVLMPYQIAFVVEADPTRRAALIAPGVQGLGCAAGPLLCSFVVTDHDARGALVMAGACLAIAFAIAAAVHGRRILARRSAAVSGHHAALVSGK